MGVGAEGAGIFRAGGWGLDDLSRPMASPKQRPLSDGPAEEGVGGEGESARSHPDSAGNPSRPSQLKA